MVPRQAGCVRHAGPGAAGAFTGGLLPGFWYHEAPARAPAAQSASGRSLPGAGLGLLELTAQAIELVYGLLATDSSGLSLEPGLFKCKSGCLHLLLRQRQLRQCGRHPVGHGLGCRSLAGAVPQAQPADDQEDEDHASGQVGIQPRPPDVAFRPVGGCTAGGQHRLPVGEILLPRRGQDLFPRHGRSLFLRRQEGLLPGGGQGLLDLAGLPHRGGCRLADAVGWRGRVIHQDKDSPLVLAGLYPSAGDPRVGGRRRHWLRPLLQAVPGANRLMQDLRPACEEVLT